MKNRGILIFGASGVGDTTLGREAARKLGVPHIDIDDYIWHWDVATPYTQLYTRAERVENLRRAIGDSECFVMSGSMFSIREHFNLMFDLAVLLSAPTEVRLERLKRREYEEFGERILPGGDMNESYEKLLRDAATYETTRDEKVSSRYQHEIWAAELPCVLRMEGEGDIQKNAAAVVTKWLEMRESEAAK